MIEFLKAFLVGVAFFGTLSIAFCSEAAEAPPVPHGSTFVLRGVEQECFTTAEFRHIVEWVEFGKHVQGLNLELEALLEVTRANLDATGQAEAARTAQLRAAEEEVARLRLMVTQQQDDYEAREKQSKLRKGLAWGGIILLAAAAASFGVAWGMSR